MKVLLLLINIFSIFLVLQYIVMYVMEYRCAGKLSGGFGGPFMYVLSPTSTKPKYRLIKMKKKKKKKKPTNTNTNHATKRKSSPQHRTPQTIVVGLHITEIGPKPA